MIHLAALIREATIMLQPTLIESTPKVFEMLGCKDNDIESILDFSKIEGCVVSKGQPLFPRLDTAKEYEFIKDLMNGK